MIYEFTKIKGASFVHYTFEINNTKVRVAFNQVFNKNIEDKFFVPIAMYGLIDKDNVIPPKFGVTLEIITTIEKDELIENVVNCTKDFVENHNSCKYSFVKVLKTENLIDKANDYNSKILEIIGKDKVEIIEYEENSKEDKFYSYTLKNKSK